MSVSGTSAAMRFGRCPSRRPSPCIPSLPCCSQTSFWFKNEVCRQLGILPHHRRKRKRQMVGRLRTAPFAENAPFDSCFEAWISDIYSCFQASIVDHNHQIKSKNIHERSSKVLVRHIRDKREGADARPGKIRGEDASADKRRAPVDHGAVCHTEVRGPLRISFVMTE